MLFQKPIFYILALLYATAVATSADLPAGDKEELERLCKNWKGPGGDAQCCHDLCHAKNPWDDEEGDFDAVAECGVSGTVELFLCNA